MQYKRYEARTLKEALHQVKKELGPEALILSSRSVRKDQGMFSMLGKNWVEVTAAADHHSIATEDVQKQDLHEPTRESSDALQNLLPKGREPGSALHCSLTGQSDFHDTFMNGSCLGTFLSQLGYNEVLLDLFKRLNGHGVNTQITLNLLERIRNALSVSHKEMSSANVLSVLRKLLEKEIPVIEPEPKYENGPAVMAMLGATGVGKTTTVAKLAARFALMQGKKVALATLDTYRIAAVEQLRVYADIMRLPLEVIHTARDLKVLIKKYGDFDLILMDTAGRSPNNDGHLQDLKNSLPEDGRVQNYILISAGTQGHEMARILERFSLVELSGLIFTKVDECSRFGSMFNLLYRCRLPLAYMTTGQKVPDDLEQARSLGILKRMLLLAEKE